MLLSTLLRAGNEKQALQVGAPRIPQWASFDMLIACAERRPPQELAAFASKVQASDDPETNYLNAANLAYCGQTKAALALLKKAIDRNYCSYPAVDSDPFFASMKNMPELRRLRAAGMTCQQNFVAARGRIRAGAGTRAR
jgi:hypothetical protein